MVKLLLWAKSHRLYILEFKSSFVSSKFVYSNPADLYFSNLLLLVAIIVSYPY